MKYLRRERAMIMQKVLERYPLVFIKIKSMEELK